MTHLGPKKKACIPEVVRTTDGLSTDTNVILEEWRNTFDKLYNPKVGSQDKPFYQNALKYMSEYDTNTPPDNNLENDIINCKGYTEIEVEESRGNRFHS